MITEIRIWISWWLLYCLSQHRPPLGWQVFADVVDVGLEGNGASPLEKVFQVFMQGEASLLRPPKEVRGPAGSKFSALSESQEKQTLQGHLGGSVAKVCLWLRS